MKKSKYFLALNKKIDKKTVKVGIIGLGYVGLPLAISFVKNKINVVGIDTDIKKINLLKKNRSYINTISNKEIFSHKKFFTFTNKLSSVNKCNIIIFCLPTPLKKNFDPDVSFIKNSFNTTYPYLKRGTMICLESTTYPGTTDELVAEKLKKKFLLGNDFFLSYSPEREDPGNKKYSIEKITKIVSGYSHNCLALCKNLYSKITKVHEVSTLRAAETTKLFENIFRSVNIGLVNEMKMICDKMNLDIHEIIDAAKTKPFGYMEFRPGPGLGGHCIPIDPFLLTWKAKEYGINTKFIELSGQINAEMPNYVCNKIFDYFLKKKYYKKPSIVIVGISYKKNTDDIRESPSLKIIEILNKSNFNVFFYDPFFSKMPSTRKYKLNNKRYDIYKNKLKKIDLVVLVTDHDNLDYNFIYKNSNHIIDTRGKFKKSTAI